MAYAAITSANQFKREETDKELIIQLQNENGGTIMPDTSHQWTAKIANQAGYRGDYPVKINGTQISLKSEQFDKLPADTYWLEIWEQWPNDGDPQTEIFPSPGKFLQFEILENITDSLDSAAKSISIDGIISSVALKASMNIDISSITMADPGTKPSVKKTATGQNVSFALVIPRGEKGDAATVKIGKVTTGKPTDQAAVTNSGDEHDAVLDVTIPQGQPGEAATVKIGKVTTTTPDKPAAVTNSGDAHNAVFDIVIPQGKTGATPTLEAGAATKLAPGATPTCSLQKTDTGYKIALGIPQGATGAMPQRGKDYWTADDINTIKAWNTDQINSMKDGLKTDLKSYIDMVAPKKQDILDQTKQYVDEAILNGKW